MRAALVAGFLLHHVRVPSIQSVQQHDAPLTLREITHEGLCLGPMQIRYITTTTP